MSSITTTGVRPSAPGADHSVWYAGRVFTVLVTSAETDGRYTVVEETMQRGTSLDLPLRIHNTETVCAFLVDGEVTVEMGDEARSLAVGGCVAIPSGIPHRFLLASDSARLINVYAPGGFDGFFRDLGEPASSAARARLTPARLDIERLVSVAAHYSVEIVAAAA
jgi:mannose-6-phosphate isomerase-like protein (cupin superfamily)